MGIDRGRPPRCGSSCRVLLLLLLLSAACAFPGSVRPTVKIGLVAPFEGRYRYVGYDAIHAVRLVLQEANQRGGVGGHGVELVAYDDGAVPSMAAEQAQKLGVDPDVIGTIGHFRHDTTAAALAVYGRAGLPLVAPTAVDATPGSHEKMVYSLSPSDSSLAAALLDRAAALAGDTAVVLATGGEPLGAVLHEEARERGLPVLSESAHRDGGSLAALSPDARVTVIALEPVEAGEVVSALREEGWTGAVLGGPALAATDFVAVAGAAAEGAEFITPWPFPRDLPAAEGFTLAYLEMSGGAQPGPHALAAHDATQMLLAAVERAAATGELTRATMASALSSADEEGMLHQVFAETRLSSAGALHWYSIGPDGAPQPLNRR